MPMIDALMAVDEALKATRKVAEVINRGPGGREVALAITKLEEAEMWLRKAAE